MTNDCGLSTRDDLLGYAPTVEGLLGLGYAVAMTDYEGLGSPGVHLYLEPRTAAFNVIDAVRALRLLDGAVSTKWLAFGESQGGQAAWAANEFASSYGDGFELVGSVAMAPAANLTPIVQRVLDGRLTQDQRIVLPAILVGASRSSTTIDLSAILPNVSADDMSKLIGCDNAARVAAASRIGEITLTDAAAAEVTNVLRLNSLPQHELLAPMLVLNGDKDMLIAPAWVETAVEQACALGGVIEHDLVSDRGHNDLASDQRVFSWISDRFLGRPAVSNCAKPKAGG